MTSNSILEASKSQSGFSYDSDIHGRYTIGTSDAEPYDFIKFLEVCQNLNFDFLPITWQPALDNLGNGGQAEIRQSLVNLAMSFAFRRVKVQGDTRETENTAYQSLVSQITILGYPGIRNHPNIVSLIGVCWDVRPAQAIQLPEHIQPPDDIQFQCGVQSRQWKVWPVLVFEKTKHGDLNCFMASKLGMDLDIAGRLKLCVDIANGLRDLHNNGE